MLGMLQLWRVRQLVPVASGRGGRAAEEAWAGRGAGAGGQAGGAGEGADDCHRDGGSVSPIWGALLHSIYNTRLVVYLLSITL